ncbi:uncharacterized protein LOC123257429 [Drosophila ananassae]|uniref:uncharacterized protein LOC123257429 n=1 Tax=Drosophila ananassae TaxID=7217 RepID=UPI001CFF5BD7|nr:uncharacterized protein LOC123257429 [Drosophila ananassae]
MPKNFTCNQAAEWVTKRHNLGASTLQLSSSNREMIWTAENMKTSSGCPHCHAESPAVLGSHLQFTGSFSSNLCIQVAAEQQTLMMTIRTPLSEPQILSRDSEGL